MSTDDIQGPSAGGSWLALPVEHLQLSLRVNDALRKRDICTVGQALHFSELGVAFQFPYAPELFECARQARESIEPDGINWRNYWRLRGNRFQQLAADTPEFDRLAGALSGYVVDRRSLGNAGAMLQASGIRTFPELIAGLKKGLEPVRGLGRGKLAELFERLSELASQHDAGQLPKLNPLRFAASIAASAADPAPAPYPAAEPSVPTWPEFGDEIRNLPISVLQLGAKSRWLLKAGIERIGDLDRFSPSAIMRMPNVGSLTVNALTRNLADLAASSVNGSIDWSIFSDHSGLPLVPPAPLQSAAEMLARLPEIFEQIGPHLRDDSYRQILFERLTKGPETQAKLEELGRRAVPRVSRERIRQKERKLLRQFAGALLHDVDGKMGIQFHPTMLMFWRQAAAEFAGEDEVAFDEFMTRLARVWEVEHVALIRQLPFIVAVVTGEPQLRGSFRAGARLDPRLFTLTAEVAATPLRTLRIGRQFERLNFRGIQTLGDLIREAVDGPANDQINRTLADVAAALARDGSIDWQAYHVTLGIPSLPDQSPVSAADFASGFCAAIRSLLVALHGSGRRAEVFGLRTCQPARSRPTLDAVSRIMCTHGPTIKREETLLLEEIYDILVDRNFSGLPVWLDSEWLRHVRGAEIIFRQCDSDYAVFHSRAADSWEIDLQAAEQAAPALWAIFTGYPEGRQRRRRAKGASENAVRVEPARIRLQGFQRLH